MVAFGRLPEFDGRSRNYPIRSLLGAPRPPVTAIWDCDQVLDQGQEGACVGFSWSHDLIAAPEEVPNIDNTFARQIYHRAQQLDEWPGEDYEGTSVLAGAKATTESGWLIEYRWAFSLEDILETLSYHGPVIFGVNWYSGMVNPDGQNVIHPTGSIVGGHAIMGRGLIVETEQVILHNSWGSDWGVNGTCRISWGDLWRLMSEDGECCVPVVRTQVEPTPPEPEPVPPPPEPEPVPPAPEDQPGCLFGARGERVVSWLERKFGS